MNVKVKKLPYRPRRLKEFETYRFLVTRHMKVVRTALAQAACTPQEIFLVLISAKRLSRSRAIGRLECVDEKFQIRLSGIELSLPHPNAPLRPPSQECNVSVLFWPVDGAESSREMLVIMCSRLLCNCTCCQTNVFSLQSC
jgi:hypothetical protein